MIDKQHFLGKWQFSYWIEVNESTILTIKENGVAVTQLGTRYKWEPLSNNGIHIFIDGYVDYIGFLRDGQIAGHATSEYSMNEWTWSAIKWQGSLKSKRFTERLFGKLFADRGYISQDLFETLFVDDLHLVTRIKKNMKNSLMNLYDKLILRKRAIIETVNDELKNVCHIEHTRHRSVENFAVNLVAGLIAYSLLPKKLEMNIEIIDKNKLIA